MISNGTGRGSITADGCPVELYLRFPHQGEADLVHAVVPAGARILDLGCGTGRIAHPLVELGHPVTAVDSSAEMLAHVRGVETVQSKIADLDLGRTFEAVLMASHLVNTVDDRERRALLAAAARHLPRDGVLIAEQYPPAWFDKVTNRSGGRIGEVRADLTDVRRDGDGDLVSATIHYWLDDEMWTQTFSAKRLDDDGLHSALRDAGFSFDQWLTDDRSWFSARRAE
ncbi:MAG TPA: class I SAM-dependent methyltransferase [Jatrophihabitans sp.]|nr:class I SAM-dependent methyltransferase [Jatrophihabitans sp.]